MLTVSMNDKEFAAYQKFISEGINLNDKVDIPTMVSDLEKYIAENKIEVKSDEDLVAACKEFLTVKGYESLVDTEIVDEILDYVNDNYNA